MAKKSKQKSRKKLNNSRQNSARKIARNAPNFDENSEKNRAENSENFAHNSEKISREKVLKNRENKIVISSVAEKSQNKNSNFSRENSTENSTENSAKKSEKNLLEYARKYQKIDENSDENSAQNLRKKARENSVFFAKILPVAGWIFWTIFAYIFANFAVAVFLMALKYAKITDYTKFGNFENALSSLALYCLIILLLLAPNLRKMWKKFRAKSNENFVKKSEKSSRNFAENSNEKSRENFEKNVEKNYQNSAENFENSREKNPTFFEKISKILKKNFQKQSTDFEKNRAKNAKNSRENQTQNSAKNLSKNRDFLRENFPQILMNLGISRAPKFKDFIKYLTNLPLYYLSIFAISIILSFVLPLIFGGENAREILNQTQNTGFATSENLAQIVVIFAVLVIVAPIAEEAIFRGFLFGKIRAKAGFWFSAILTSILFAVAHGQINVGIMVFVLSLFLCNLREKTGAIWAGVFLHATVNLVAFLAKFVFNLG